MTRWADQFFVQQQLKEMNLDEPAFVQHPALLGACLETPEYEQFDSTREDAEEGEGNATSMLDTELCTAEGIMPCRGSIPRCAGNSEGPRIKG